MTEEKIRSDLLELAHNSAVFERMAILGEGNVSGRINDERFLIKASGTQLSNLSADQLVEVESGIILESLDRPDLDDEQIESLLFESRTNQDALKPSVETLFHAWLLQLEGISYVGHTHPIHVNQLLCSPHAKDFAKHRLFPDQIVYCGKESVLVPYIDPGFSLSHSIAQEVDGFIKRTGTLPKTICLENHGLIAIGSSAKQVEASLIMAEKSAKVFVGAITAGGPLFLPEEQVERIAARTDEHYRQSILDKK